MVLQQNIDWYRIFDDQVALEEKELMVLSLQKKGYKELVKRINLKLRGISKMQLSNFVTNNTKKVSFHLSSSFLKSYPSRRERDEEYDKLRRRAMKFKEVNDIAERRMLTLHCKKVIFKMLKTKINQH